MRGDHRTTIAAIITAGLLLTATAYTGDEITSTLSKTGAAEAPAEKADAEPEAAPATAVATVAKTGDTITLKGTEDDLKVDAVLRKWDDNTEPGDEYTGASAGSASSPPRSSAPTQEQLRTWTAPRSELRSPMPTARGSPPPSRRSPTDPR